MTIPDTLEGWVPVLSEELGLSKVIELAFDYRGDVTLINPAGGSLTGFLFNYRTEGDKPFVQLYVPGHPDPVRVPLGNIENIHFRSGGEP